MRFDIPKKNHPNEQKYAGPVHESAQRFSHAAYKEFGSFIRSLVLFGALARRQGNTKSDIDILIIVDDMRQPITSELTEAYRLIVTKLVADIDPRLHITTLKFSTFYEYVTKGDPIAINILRDGFPIMDSGFFEPLQLLLYQGKIRPSVEAIQAYHQRAPRSLHNARNRLLTATIDLYWAVIDSAHAALMTFGYVPPSPEHVSDLLEDMHKKHRLEKRYVQTMQHFYQTMKMITHRDIKYIGASEFERYYKNAHDFVNRMDKLVRDSR